MRRAALLLVVLVLLAPTALAQTRYVPEVRSVCDETPPRAGEFRVGDPKAFRLWDPATGDVRRVETTEPFVGGYCGTTTPHALDGERFVWGEREWREDRLVWTLKLVDLATGERRALPLEFEADVRSENGVRWWFRLDLSLDDDLLLWRAEWMPPAGPGARGELGALDVASGRRADVPLEYGPLARHLLGGARVVEVRHVVNATALVSVYDAREARFVLREAPLADLALGTAYWPDVFDGRWLASGVPQAPWAFDLDRGTADPLEVPHDAMLFDLDGGALWLRDLHLREGEAGLRRLALPDGAPMVVRGAPDLHVLSVHDGVVVLGDEGPPRPPAERPSAAPALAAAATAALGLGLAAAAWRRLSRR